MTFLEHSPVSCLALVSVSLHVLLSPCIAYAKVWSMSRVQVDAYGCCDALSVCVPPYLIYNSALQSTFA